jgi:hypothetical protein
MELLLVNPYLAYQTIYDLNKDKLKHLEKSDEKLAENYIKAASNGLLKVFLKNGNFHLSILSWFSDI